MGATEPIQGGPYPVPTDAPDGPTQMKGIVDWSAGRGVMRFASAAARDAVLTGANVVDGMACYIAADRGFYVRAGGRWDPFWPYSEPVALSAATGFTASNASVQRQGRRAFLEGSFVSSAAQSITTAFKQIGTLPTDTGTGPTTNRFFTVAVFGSAVVQMQIYNTGAISIRALTGTVSMVAGASIYLDGIEYRSV